MPRDQNNKAPALRETRSRTAFRIELEVLIELDGFVQLMNLLERQSELDLSEQDFN